MDSPNLQLAARVVGPAGADLYACPVRALGAEPAQSVPSCPVCGCESALPRFALEAEPASEARSGPELLWSSAEFLWSSARPSEARAPAEACEARSEAPDGRLIAGREPAKAGEAPRLVVCEGCGLGRLHPLPDDATLRTYYPDEYYGEPGTKFQGLVEWLVRLVGSRHIGFLSRSLPRGARVLDVGCGRGVLLGALADRGFEVHGVEQSAEATRGADPRAKIRIAPRLADAAFAADFFDEVVIWHVLEHLRDPRETLAEARRILRPGGLLVVAVPNFSSAQARWSGDAWFHLDLPRHLFHFPVSGLRELVRSSGFEIESEHHFSLRQNPFGWIQSALNRCSRLPRNGLYRLLHRRAAGHAPFDRSTRWRLWLALLALAPPSLAAACLEAGLRSGATVHLVARRPSA